MMNFMRFSGFLVAITPASTNGGKMTRLSVYLLESSRSMSIPKFGHSGLDVRISLKYCSLIPAGASASAVPCHGTKFQTEIVLDITQCICYDSLKRLKDPARVSIKGNASSW
ncbi:hypothetical protein DFH29DRAFT_234479 [Suillus ampliporus]|nr:hypothetical protein DFH29DRAFT_234479 [Suillus ampliporus]